MSMAKASVKKMLKKLGAERVSDGAAAEMAEVVEKYAYAIAKKAVKLAAHAKRKTIKKEDIDLAK